MAIAIMSSGGDCAGMNPAIKYFVEQSILKKLNPYFIYDGLEGLIDNKIKKVSFENVSGIIHLGGTIIRSSRSKRFFDKKYRLQAYKNLKKHKITKIIVLGGDGSFRAMDVFYNEFGIKFVGIPATIDNDIYGTDYCLGVDTALNMIRNAVDAIRDTASSFKRAFVIETMGRECGYLALVSAITSGAEICVIPEIANDLDYQKEKIQFEMQNGRKYLLAIVAEGSKKRKNIKKWCEKELKIETRVTILGHIQRGGNPSVYDRLMASSFVKKSIDRIIQKECKGEVVVYKDSKFEFKNIDEITSNKYKLPQNFIDLYKDSYCQKCKG
jgi:6-phosphofructokinase 1